VTHPSTGIYCIFGLPFAPNNAVATLGGDGGAVGINTELGAAFGCGGGTQISVQAYGVDTDNTGAIILPFVDNGFYININ
jgi:hypothetical protein